jgi:hypothetical protein
MTRTGASQTLLEGKTDMARKSLTLSTIRALNGSELTEIVNNRLGEFDIRTQRQLKSMFKKVQEDHGEEAEEGSDHHHGGAGPEKESDKPVVEEKVEVTVSDDTAPVTEEAAVAAPEAAVAEPEAKMVDGMVKATEDEVAPAVVETTGDEEVVDEAAAEMSNDTEEAQMKMDFGGKTPLGSQVLKNLYDAVKYLNDAVEEAMMPVEHPDVKGGMSDIMGQSRAIQAAIDGLHSSAYGDALEAEIMEDEAVAVEEGQEKGGNSLEEVIQTTDDNILSCKMKSFLSRKESQVQNFQVISYSGALRRLAEDKDIPESARKSLGNLSRGLKTLQEEAANYEAPVAEDSQAKSISKAEFDSVVAERDSVLAERDAARVKVESLNTSLESAVGMLEKFAPAS